MEEEGVGSALGSEVGAEEGDSSPNASALGRRAANLIASSSLDQ
jgi:hypothetical protein